MPDIIDVLLWIVLAIVVIATVSYWWRMMKVVGWVALYLVAAVAIGGQAIARRLFRPRRESDKPPHSESA